MTIPVIIPAMLDKDAKRAAAQRAELGMMNVEEAVCGYINAMLASGNAREGSAQVALDGDWYVDAPPSGVMGARDFRVLIIRLEGEK